VGSSLAYGTQAAPWGSPKINFLFSLLSVSQWKAGLACQAPTMICFSLMATSLGYERQTVVPCFASTDAPHPPLSPHASSRLGSSTVPLPQSCKSGYRARRACAVQPKIRDITTMMKLCICSWVLYKPMALRRRAKHLNKCNPIAQAICKNASPLHQIGCEDAARTEEHL